MATILKIFLRLLFGCATILLIAALAQAASYSPDKLLKSLSRFGGTAPQRLQEWQKLVEDARQISGTEQKLQKINEFWNKRIQFMEDPEAWGLPDFWATPMESLGREKGDCEDFAIAKYFTLLASNLEVAQLRLIYVKAKIGGAGSSVVQAHMVLGYFKTPDAEPLILDNLVNEIHPASRRPDLTPVFSFNSQGVTAGTATGGSSAGTNRLSRWEDLLSRARAEGFE